MGSGPVVKGFLPAELPADLETELRRHCEEAYPYEACGALLGYGDGTAAPWEVRGIRLSTNRHPDDQRRRYFVPPDFQATVEREALARGQDVIGYYHSHPDHPAAPSEYDRAHAWPGYLYIICAVDRANSSEVNAFTLLDYDQPFTPVTLQAAACSTHPTPETSRCRSPF